jgi:glycosyltransferase involved in cell wall biosynthesis
MRAAPHPPVRASSCRVVTVGAIGIEKGFDVLLACARDAASRRLPLEFGVVGHTIDDARLMETGRVFVTGEFASAEVQTLIRAQRPSLGLLPSVWPETWCFALSDLWRAGLNVAAFDLGAPAERIRASGGRGFLLPLGLSAPAINNALLASGGIAGNQ